MATFYIVGVVLVFLFILVFEAYVIANIDDHPDIDILSGILSLILYPWFSWAFIALIALIALFVSIGDKSSNKSIKD